MKLFSTTATLLLLLAPLPISATPFGFLFDAQSPITAEDKPIPVDGENPLIYCADPSPNILEIQSVDLTPNPPRAGETLTIEAKGIFHERVEKGAKVLLQVKYGLIYLINQEADLCDQITNVGMECPLEKGEMTITKEVDLPAEIPPGQYDVLADVYTKDKVKITCLKAVKISFH